MDDSGSDFGQAPAMPLPLQMPKQMPLNQQLSPYLDIDPGIFRTAEPQYILPEGASAKRGRLELAFSQIGGGVFAGYLWGSAVGAGCFIGSGTAPRGTVMLTYSVVGVLGANALPVADEINTVAAATVTGLVYKGPQAYAMRSAVPLAKGSLVGAVCGVAAVGIKYLWERY